jgi:hypothetical protein
MYCGYPCQDLDWKRHEPLCGGEGGGSSSHSCSSNSSSNSSNSSSYMTEGNHGIGSISLNVKERFKLFFFLDFGNTGLRLFND